MKPLIALCVFACVTISPLGTQADTKHERGYWLRDTTGLPPPPAGKAQVVVARDQQPTRTLKPEFVFIDRMPVGMLAQQSVVTMELEPGWHRLWLGRGANAEVWLEFQPDGRYLFRLREGGSTGTWRGDLVREAAAGYASYALGKGMRLSVLDESGRGSLERDLPKASPESAKHDSTARAHAIQHAKLPIVIAEAWYLPLPSSAPAGEFESNAGTLRLDETSLRFMHRDSVVVEIPRHAITEVRYGSQKGGHINAWLKVTYDQGGSSRSAAFADAKESSSTGSYNRLFAELARSVSPR